MKPIRRHLSYANVVATLALLFAMSGGALAAKHYLINSTKQINPKVLKKLRGHRGPRGLGASGPSGPRGATGLQGAEGPKGAQGPAGQSALSPLPSGQSESGDYGIRTPNNTTSGFLDQSVTFPVQLPAPIPKVNVIYTTISAPVTHCAGVGKADPGFLCIYSGNAIGVKTPPNVESFEEKFLPDGSGRYGFDLEWAVTEAGGFDIGTYTVTAP